MTTRSSRLREVARGVERAAAYTGALSFLCDPGVVGEVAQHDQPPKRSVLGLPAAQ
jgi:hypothetical protein